MKKVRITVMRKACYQDLMAQYENPIEHTCDIEEGAVFIANGWQRPEGLCESAWETMSPFVMGLAHDEGGLLRWLDEKSPFGYDFLQRWFSSCKLPAGNSG